MTKNPKASEIATALECVHADMDNPFVILDPPPADGFIPGFCQVLADDEGYVCEIRLFGDSSDNYVHYRLVGPDEQGRIWEPELEGPGSNAGYFPDIRTVLRVFMAYREDPLHLPEIGEFRWVDVTKEVDEW